MGSRGADKHVYITASKNEDEEGQREGLRSEM